VSRLRMPLHRRRLRSRYRVRHGAPEARAVPEVWLDRYEVSLESSLQTALLLAAPARLPALRLFRRNIGAARMGGDFVVRFAIPGQCDLYGITRGGGHIEVELKSLKKPLSPEQKAWGVWCVEWGVPHVVLRSADGETVEQTVGRWCVELERLIKEHYSDA
jgi:hypothetical protein